MNITQRDGAARPVRVWDVPLRIWHWALIAALSVSLYTGLSGQIHLFDLHAQAGYTTIGLLLFRLGWGVWGGRYARWTHYGTTPARLFGYVRGRHDPTRAHSPPGALMAIAVCAVIALQAGTGLFASDDIFNRGPLAGYLTNTGVRQATWIHVRLFWAIIALGAVHMLALAAYWLIGRERLAIGMITGRKPIAGEPTPNYLVRALLTLAVAIVATRYLIAL
jgi:cytochrome b